jgi:hypothetical protein
MPFRRRLTAQLTSTKKCKVVDVHIWRLSRLREDLDPWAERRSNLIARPHRSLSRARLSIVGLFSWPPPRSFSTSRQRRSQAGHPGWVRKAAPGSRATRCGSAVQPKQDRQLTARGVQTLAAARVGTHLQRRAPFVLEDVQANAAEAVNVGVVDLGDESHLRRSTRAQRLASKTHRQLPCRPTAAGGTRLAECSPATNGGETAQRVPLAAP